MGGGGNRSFGALIIDSLTNELTQNCVVRFPYFSYDASAWFFFNALLVT